MPDTQTGQVNVVLTLEQLSYSQAVKKAQRALRDLGDEADKTSKHTVSSMAAASGALRSLEGSIPIRAAERFIGMLPGVGSAVLAAFPVVGAFALLNVIVRGATELATFVKKAQEAKEQFRLAFQEMTNASRLSNDELERSNLQLESQIAKLEGKHQNVLAAELIDARIEADKLAISAQAAADKIRKLLEENKVGFLAQMIGGEGGSKEVAGNIMNYQNLKRDAQQRQADLLHSGDTEGAKKAGAEYQQYLKNEIAEYKKQISTRTGTVTSSVSGDAGNSFDVTKTYAEEYGDQTKNLTALRSALSLAYNEQDRIGLNAQNVTDTGQLKRDQDAKESRERALAASRQQMERYRQELASEQAKLVAGPDENEQAFHTRQLTQEALFWAKRLDIARSGTDLYRQIQKQLDEVDRQGNQQFAQARNEAIRLAVEQQKLIGEITAASAQDLTRSSDATAGLREDGAAAKAYLQALNDGTEAAARAAYAQQEQAISVDFATGAISRLDAAQRFASLHAAEYARQLDLLQTKLQSIAADPSLTALERAGKTEDIKNQIDQANAQRAMQRVQDDASIRQETPAGAFTETLQQYVQETQDTASQIREIWRSTWSGVNNQLIEMMTQRHHSSWTRQWRNTGSEIFKNVAGVGLQRAEGAVLGALGMHGKPDGTSSNPLHVVISGGSGIASGAKGLASAAVSAGSTAAGFIGKALSLFGGFFADGGEVPGPGVPIMVGERGPEMFLPKTQGAIIPNHDLGGERHTHNWNIDARGASDPAAVNAAIRRAAPSLVAASVRAGREMRARRPAASQS